MRKFRLAAGAILMFISVTAASAQNKGFDTRNMNRDVDACTDFFEFANGAWLSSTQIPASESRWGTFNVLGDRNNETLKAILTESSKTKAAKGSDTQMIGDFYAACMDEDAINKAGIKPLLPYFKSIDKIKSTADLQRQIAEMHAAGFPAVFSFGAGADLKNSKMVIINAGQGGLTLPNRDYYVKDDKSYVETRSKFVAYMTNMFKLAGASPEQAAANAKIVLDLQTQLANASLSPVELRDPDKRYNKISFADAQKLTPNFSWAAYTAVRRIPSANELNLSQPSFFTAVDAMMKDVPVEHWRVYLKWMTLNSAAPSLAKPFADENFDFFGRYLSGAKEQQPRWKTCVQNTNETLGEALGMEYVKRQFGPESKARMNELIDNLQAAMKDRIDALEWMGADTKVQAQKKLSTFKRKIGYPDVLRGYKGLAISRRSHADNVFAARRFEVTRNAADIGKPVDRTRWFFTPPTVNASYSPVNNEITFPAGILQPPFFNADADDAINYGAIGGVIGHEITHGFDDSGSKFDADGNLNMWWTDEDRKKFDERTACVIDQFNKYEVQPGLFIDGKLTLGENIGDFAGLTVAYDAYMRSLEGKQRPADIDGFTPEQRFFLGWAQVWAGKYTPEAERLQVKSNVHSLPRWRVNGPLSNMPQFAKAFGCKQGQPMVRENMCSIW